jgi:hypothetical protein
MTQNLTLRGAEHHRLQGRVSFYVDVQLFRQKLNLYIIF